MMNLNGKNVRFLIDAGAEHPFNFEGVVQSENDSELIINDKKVGMMTIMKGRIISYIEIAD